MADIRLIEIKEDILSDNKNLADEIRDMLRIHNVFMLNLMSSPGSGKTSLIVNTIRSMQDTRRIGVIEGDIDSTVDDGKSSPGRYSRRSIKDRGILSSRCCHD